MTFQDKVAVCSSSFSKDTYLREKLLSLYPNTIFNDFGHRLKGNELVKFLQDREKVVFALEEVNIELLENLPNLKHISKFGVGLDNICFDSLKKKNVTLSWQGGVNKRSVSELTMFFILGLVRGGYFSSLNVANSQWQKSKCNLIQDKKIGIIGLGHIGKDLVKLLQPFDVEIWGNDIEDRMDFANKNGILLKSKEEIFKECDVITLHIPKTNLTEGLINSGSLKTFKKTSYLINTARGGLINETDLLTALDNNSIAGAALDVFSIEPIENKKLSTHSKLINTPHIGGSAEEAIRMMGESAIYGLSNTTYHLD